MERSLLLFRESVKSKETYHTYLTRVKLFLKYHRIQSYDDVIKKPNLQELFEDWIISKKQEVNPNGLATYYYGVKNFFDANELAPQVQNLRELRDNKLVQTESGSAFISGFNNLYYSFSPTIADYERENPYFKEFVKLSITPMISSLSILNHVDMDTEKEVLTYGISLILLNAGMYVGIPVTAVILTRKKITKQ